MFYKIDYLTLAGPKNLQVLVLKPFGNIDETFVNGSDLNFRKKK